jgi:hypothetical protein
MLDSLDVSPASTAVEVGPGFAAKVGFGLAELGFRGTLTVVEPNDAARSWVAARYRRLLPRAEVLAVAESVPGATSIAEHPIDLLLANHFLDDLLLNAAVSPGEGARLFSQMRPGAECSGAFVETWRLLFRTPERLNALVGRVAEDFSHFVGALRPGLMVLNHYPSWRHQSCGLDAIHIHSLSVMQLISGMLGTKEARPGGCPLSPEAPVCWLVHRPGFPDPEVPL